MKRHAWVALTMIAAGALAACQPPPPPGPPSPYLDVMFTNLRTTPKAAPL